MLTIKEQPTPTNIDLEAVKQMTFPTWCQNDDPQSMLHFTKFIPTKIIKQLQIKTRLLEGDLEK